MYHHHRCRQAQAHHQYRSRLHQHHQLAPHRARRLHHRYHCLFPIARATGYPQPYPQCHRCRCRYPDSLLRHHCRYRPCLQLHRRYHLHPNQCHDSLLRRHCQCRRSLLMNPQCRHCRNQYPACLAYHRRRYQSVMHQFLALRCQ